MEFNTMINLLGLGKKTKDVKVTIEYCPKNITLPYKVKKLINQASLKVPNSNKDPFGFNDKEVHVGEFLNESQLQHLVNQAREGKGDLSTVEIVEGSSHSIGEELLLD